MNHDEAVQERSTERYLLDELTAEQREAFEEHLFDCQECARDLQAASLFLTEAKAQLPYLVSQTAAQQSATGSAAPAVWQAETHPAGTPSNRKKPWWSLWTGSGLFAPGFAAPAFALLLGVIAYQNLATIPGLRAAATEPRVVPWTMVHAGTRGAEPTPVQADRKQGAVMLIDLPMQPVYASYAFDFYDPQGKRVWSQTVQHAGQGGDEGMTVSLLIPGAGLQQGSYTLNISGISSDGARVQIGRRALDVHFDE